MTVKMSAPPLEGHQSSAVWTKQGVEVVLLFGILAALTKPTGKTK